MEKVIIVVTNVVIKLVLSNFFNWIGYAVCVIVHCIYVCTVYKDICTYIHVFVYKVFPVVDLLPGTRDEGKSERYWLIMLDNGRTHICVLIALIMFLEEKEG